MAIFRYRGVSIKMNYVDRLFAEWWFGRQIPKNYLCARTMENSIKAIVVFCGIGWVLTHIPFCTAIGAGVFLFGLHYAIVRFSVANPFTGIGLSMICYYLYQHNISLDMSILGFHYEKYVYYIVYAMTAYSLAYRYYNFLIWRGVLTIHERYKIPLENQMALRRKYADVDYGEEGEKVFKNYKEAAEYHQKN